MTLPCGCMDPVCARADEALRRIVEVCPLERTWDVEEVVAAIKEGAQAIHAPLRPIAEVLAEIRTNPRSK